MQAGPSRSSTYLELRESTADGRSARVSRTRSKGLVLLHVLELAASRRAARRGHVRARRGRARRAVSRARASARRGRLVASRCRTCAGTVARRASAATRTAIARGRARPRRRAGPPRVPATRRAQGARRSRARCAVVLAFACEKPEASPRSCCRRRCSRRASSCPKAPGGLAGFFKKVGPTSPGRTGWDAAQTHERRERRRPRCARTSSRTES